MKKSKDLYSGIVLFVFSVFYLLLSKGIKITGSGIGNAQTMPVAVGVIVLILSGILIITNLKTIEKPENIQEEKSNYLKVALTLLYIIGFVLCLKTVGFLVSCIVYLILQMSLLAEPKDRNYKKIVIIAVIAAFVINILFVKVFSIVLPSGFVGFLS